MQFGVHFELPNRSKSDTENKLIFKRFWGRLEISESGSGTLIVTGDGKRALSPIGVALSSLCDNGGSEEGTGRGLIWIPRVTESGLPARLELHWVRSAIKEGVKREPSDRRFGSLG